MESRSVESRSTPVIAAGGVVPGPGPGRRAGLGRIVDWDRPTTVDAQADTDPGGWGVVRDDAGAVVTDAQLLERVLTTGAAVVLRGPVESVDFVTWRRELRRAARARGRRISVNRLDGGVVVVSDPDFIVDPEQLARAVRAIPFPPGTGQPQPREPTSAASPLRLVDEPDVRDEELPRS